MRVELVDKINDFCVARIVPPVAYVQVTIHNLAVDDLHIAVRGRSDIYFEMFKALFENMSKLHRVQAFFVSFVLVVEVVSSLTFDDLFLSISSVLVVLIVDVEDVRERSHQKIFGNWTIHRKYKYQLSESKSFKE